MGVGLGVLSSSESLLSVALSCTSVSVGCSGEVESWLDTQLLKHLQETPKSTHSLTTMPCIKIRLIIPTWRKRVVVGSAVGNPNLFSNVFTPPVQPVPGC